VSIFFRTSPARCCPPAATDAMGNEIALLPREEPKDPTLQASLTIIFEQALNMPEANLSVEVTNTRTSDTATVSADEKHSRSPTFACPVVLPSVNLEDVLVFQIHSAKFIGSTLHRDVGWTEWRVSDFIRRPSRTFPINDSNGLLVAGEDGDLSFLKVRLDLASFPPNWPQPMVAQPRAHPKHLLLITRGTRGDVQPFAVLGFGIAALLGWKVTICTELRCKEKLFRMLPVISKGSLTEGLIHFRPTGGDTSKKIESTISKKAMNSKSEVIQALMLSRTEVEFFPSEGAIHYWAKTLMPDAIIFGFTLANIALMCSESLQIPIIGFLLQPTVIPSQVYTPVIPLKESRSRLGKRVTSHHMQERLKKLMEAIPFDPSALNHMRKRRGLSKIDPGSVWKILTTHRASIVVPINEVCFGGKPEDWPLTAEFTDFIFSPAAGKLELDPEYKEFIRNARENNTPLVFMGFSSMPVSREDILSIACLMITKCSPTPAVVAMVGERPTDDISSSLKQRCDDYKARGLLFEGKSAPLGLLLPEMDCNIIHGGLGTTAEALRSGRPVIVTGILLMDQRFWGHQISALGVGPVCCHVSEFDKHCVEWVDEALRPGSVWAAKAKELAAGLPKGDGIQQNVEAIERHFRSAVPIQLLDGPMDSPPTSPVVRHARGLSPTPDVIACGRRSSLSKLVPGFLITPGKHLHHSSTPDAARAPPTPLQVPKHSRERSRSSEF
jgi:UDP:flavonoid glycosyltransferase YjiC (YdhE family)